MKLLQWWQHSRWYIKTAVILALLYLIYALVGFFVVPEQVRTRAQQALSDLTGREVTIERVEFNPLALTATVSQFAINDEQTEVLLGFQRFYVDFELSSLFRWSWHFDEIALDGLTVRARRNDANAFNFDDVIAHVQAQLEAGAKEEDVPADEENGQPPAVSVATLQLTNGDLQFTEASGQSAQTVVLPMAFTVRDFATRAQEEKNNRYALDVEGPDGGALSWRGQFALTPFVAEGELAVEQIDMTAFARLVKDHFRFRIPSGVLDVAVNYHVVTEPETVISLDNGSLSLANVIVQEQGREQASLSLPSVEVSEVSVDTGRREVVIPAVVLNEPVVNGTLTEDGLDLATLFTPVKSSDEAAPSEEPGDAEQPGEQSGEEQQGDAESPPWTVKLAQLSVKNSSLAMTDQTLTPVRTVSISENNLTVNDITVTDDIALRWQGNATVLEQGSLTHSGEGTVVPLDLSAAAELKSLPLSTISPWVEVQAPLAIKEGGVDAQIQATVSGEQPDIGVQGLADVNGLVVNEHGRQLLSLQQMKVRKINVDTSASKLVLGEVAIAGLDMVNRVDEDGRDVATRITEDMSAAGAENGSADKGSVNNKKASEPWLVQIPRLSLSDSVVRHEDKSQSPEFKVGLYELKGTVTGLDSRPGQRADIDLSAQVDRYAPFEAKGTVSVDPLYVDLDVELENYEMTSLTPYTGRFLGFAVEKGQLGVDSNVSIDDSRLKSGTSIAADKFFLGDKVDSEEAVKAPIKLGLAVLRNRKGEIALPLKVEGDLNDPSFSVGGLVIKVLSNVLVKAATSPFSVLSGLVGGKNLETVTFAAGKADIEGETSASLDALAKVLTERPNLAISLTGSTNADDRSAIATTMLGEALDGEDWPGIETALLDKGLRRKIKRRFERETDKEVETLVPEPLPEDRDARDQTLAKAAWEALRKRQAAAVNTQTLQLLANARAENAKAYLVQEKQIGQARLFISDTKTDQSLAGVSLDLEKR